MRKEQPLTKEEEAHNRQHMLAVLAVASWVHSFWHDLHWELRCVYCNR